MLLSQKIFELFYIENIKYWIPESYDYKINKTTVGSCLFGPSEKDEKLFDTVQKLHS